MIPLSDLESYDYIAVQLLIGTLIITSVFFGISAQLSTGAIFAMVTYLLDFSFEVLTLPLIFQQFIRLKEITNRIDS